MPDIHDIFVIGSGINGCGIARDAVGRGYSVCLAEMNDLASGTWSYSTNFGADLYAAEVRYLVDHEWAVTAEDILWRRTKRGFKLGQEQAASLDEFLKA